MKTPQDRYDTHYDIMSSSPQDIPAIPDLDAMMTLLNSIETRLSSLEAEFRDMPRCEWQVPVSVRIKQKRKPSPHRDCGRLLGGHISLCQEHEEVHKAECESTW
jgi:hypothetical protein